MKKSFNTCFPMVRSGIMLTAFLLLFYSLIITEVNAQINRNEMYTKNLEITFNKTTSIIFPSAIKNVDRGSRDILAQKVKGVENILQLKAGREGFTETNLTVITADGELNHFIVNYAAQPEELVVNINIGKEEFISHKSSSTIFKSTVNKELLAKHAMNILSSKPTVKFVTKRNNKIGMSLQGIYVQDNVILYRLKIKNQSNIDYDIDFLRFYVRDKKQAKRTASQEVEVSPVYTYGNENNIIKGKSEIELVYALEKFTIPDAKLLVVELYEKKGGRNLELSIKNKTIVKAKPVPSTEEMRM